MPKGDRTGPFGEGPKTGRQMGYCVGNEQAGFVYQNQNRGMGYGRQFRGGFRFRHGQARFHQGIIADVSEKTLIENEIRILKDQLSALEDRLSKKGED